MYTACSSFAALSGNSDLKLHSEIQEDDEIGEDTEDVDWDRDTTDKERDDKFDSEDKEDDVEAIDHLLKVNNALLYIVLSQDKFKRAVPFDPYNWLRFAHNFICVMILKITAYFQAGKISPWGTHDGHAPAVNENRRKRHLKSEK